MNRTPGMPVGQSHESRDAWPFFIVIDTSESMSWPDDDGTVPLDSATQGLNDLLDGISDDVEASQNSWFEIITFAGEASRHRDLVKAEALPSVSPFKVGTWTNYKAAWEMVGARVVEGYNKLLKEGYEVARPVVFFITDGNPGGKAIEQTERDWRPYINSMNDALGDKAPRIIALGVGRVNRDILLSLHSKRPHGAAAVAKPGYSTTSLVGAAIEQIKNTIIHTALSGKFSWQSPEGLDNLCQLDVH